MSPAAALPLHKLGVNDAKGYFCEFINRCAPVDYF